MTLQYLEANFVESLHDGGVRVRERRHVVELEAQLLHVPQGAAARGMQTILYSGNRLLRQIIVTVACFIHPEPRSVQNDVLLL